MASWHKDGEWLVKVRAHCQTTVRVKAESRPDALRRARASDWDEMLDPWKPVDRRVSAVGARAVSLVGFLRRKVTL